MFCASDELLERDALVMAVLHSSQKHLVNTLLLCVGQRLYRGHHLVEQLFFCLVFGMLFGFKGKRAHQGDGG